MSEDEGLKWFVPETEVENDDKSQNGSSNSSTAEEPYKQIISDEVMWSLNLYIVILLCGALAMFGAVANVINMIIFTRLGLKDSMSVCLFALAFTDFSCSFLVVVTRVFSIWGNFFPTDVVDPMAVWYVGFGWVVDSLYLCSGWITTFLSIERCTCVVFPFKVREIFTRNRSIAAIVVIYVVIESTYFPLYVTHWLEWTTWRVVTAANTTIHKRRLIVMFTRNRAEIESYMSLLSGNVLPVPALIIIVGSVVWMIYGLKASSKLRTSMTATKGDEGGKQDGGKLNYKTRRLVTVVLLLATVFTFCSIPRLFAKYMYILNPETHEGGREVNMYSFKWQLTRVAFAINASVNIFIYLKINSSYRAKFQELFSCISSKSYTGTE